MSGARFPMFHYHQEEYTYEEILAALKEEGYVTSPSRRLAYHDPDNVPDEWPVRGHLVEGYDLSISPPSSHPQFGMIGTIAAAPKGRGLHSEEETRKLYRKLKRQFETNLNAHYRR